MKASTHTRPNDLKNPPIPSWAACTPQRRVTSSFKRFALPALILLCAATSGALRAATLTVINVADSGAGSLRAALASASDGDTINFSVAGTITLTSGDLVINKSLTIAGPGAPLLTVSGNSISRVFRVDDGTAVEKAVVISGLTVTEGNVIEWIGNNREGGGIRNTENLILSGCVISDNKARHHIFELGIAAGGGIFNAGSLTVISGTISGNTVQGIFYAEGGGIFNSGTATLTLINSTVSGNQAVVSGSEVVFALGGGIRDLGGRVTLINSTISGNQALSPDAAPLAAFGGGIYTGTLTLVNSLVAGNTATSGPDIQSFESMVSNGANFIGDPSGVFGSLQATDKTFASTGTVLGQVLNPALQNNGGPTPTHALVASSLAINAGANADALDQNAHPLTTDQRGIGFPRIVGGIVDIGAFESAPVAITSTTTVAPSAGQYSDGVILHAGIAPNTAAGSVQFSVNGSSVGSPVAVSGGVAELSHLILPPAGSYQIKAVFTSSDAGVSGSEGTSTLTVTRENAVVTPRASNPLAVKVNAAGGTAGPITLWADITEVADGRLGNISNAVPVTFTLQPVAGGLTIIQTATVTGGGVGGTLAAYVTLSSVPVNVYDITIRIGGNYYMGSAETSLAVYDPSLGFVTGGGTVTHNGVLANFAFSVKYLKNGQPQGSLLYIEHRVTGDVVIKGNSMGSLAIVDNTAVITGKATLNAVGNYGFRATVVDNGEPGATDQFSLKVTNPAGGAMADLTFGPLTINGGNIQVPQGAKK